MQYEAQPINLFNGYGYIYFLKIGFAQTHISVHWKKKETENIMSINFKS